MQRTPIAIIGAGPAGLLLGALLQRRGIHNLVIERRSPEQVLADFRSCVLEPASVALLNALRLDDCLRGAGPAHSSIWLSSDGQRQRLELQALSGHALQLCLQTELLRQLMQARAASGQQSHYEIEKLRLKQFLHGEQALLQFERQGMTDTLACDFIIGADGFHGVSRAAVPPDAYHCFERVYPFAWLGVLADLPPPTAEPIYAQHPRGFALCMPLGEQRLHVQIQCNLSDRLEQWTDVQCWAELRRRLDPASAAALQAGTTLDKRITPVRSFVVEPLRFGRLILLGDAAHVVPPTGGKGLNLAIAETIDLANALEAHYAGAPLESLDAYSEQALRRVWRAERFSWSLTRLLHSFPDQNGFDQKIQQAELDYLRSSTTAQRCLAENFAGTTTGTNP